MLPPHLLVRRRGAFQAAGAGNLIGGIMADQPKELFDKIARDLAAEDSSVKAGKLFGSPCIKTNGKAFATFSHGDLVVKLMGKSHAHALSLAGAKLFDPGMGYAD